jgi:hypothetical protein
VKLTANNSAFIQTGQNAGNFTTINSLTILTTSDQPGVTQNNFIAMNDGSGGTSNTIRINSGGFLISGPHNIQLTAFTTFSSGTDELVFNIQGGTTALNSTIVDGPAGATALLPGARGQQALAEFARQQPAKYQRFQQLDLAYREGQMRAQQAAAVRQQINGAQFQIFNQKNTRALKSAQMAGLNVDYSRLTIVECWRVSA